MKGKETCRIKNIFLKRSRFLRNVFKSFWFCITLETIRDACYDFVTNISYYITILISLITKLENTDIYVVCTCIYIYIYIHTRTSNVRNKLII